MGEAQGKKVSPPPLRHRRSRRRRPLARSSHQRPGGSRRSDSTEEKTWRKSSNPHKRPPSWGEGKETLAYRRAPLHVRTPATQRPHGGSCRIHRDAASVRSSAAATALWSRVGGDLRQQPPSKRRTARTQPWPATSADEAVSRRRQCLVRRRARGREHHARPSRGCHDDRACNCHGLSPTVGRYADVGEAERGMISRDGGRHYKEEPDRCANEGRAQRREGDLPGNKG